MQKILFMSIFVLSTMICTFLCLWSILNTNEDLEIMITVAVTLLTCIVSQYTCEGVAQAFQTPLALTFIISPKLENPGMAWAAPQQLQPWVPAVGQCRSGCTSWAGVICPKPVLVFHKRGNLSLCHGLVWVVSSYLLYQKRMLRPQMFKEENTTYLLGAASVWS